MDYNPVGWFEIYVKDMDRAKSFYQGVLGVTLAQLPSPDPNFEMWAFPMNPEAKGASGALVKMNNGDEMSGNGTTVYFSCEDCSVEAGRVVSSGGNLVQEKMSIGDYGFIAMAIDTEGNMIGLHSLP